MLCHELRPTRSALPWPRISGQVDRSSVSATSNERVHADSVKQDQTKRWRIYYIALIFSLNIVLFPLVHFQSSLFGDITRQRILRDFYYTIVVLPRIYHMYIWVIITPFTLLVILLKSIPIKCDPGSTAANFQLLISELQKVGSIWNCLCLFIDSQ